MKRFFKEFLWLFLIGASVMWGLKDSVYRRYQKDFSMVEQRAEHRFVAGSTAGH